MNTPITSRTERIRNFRRQQRDRALFFFLLGVTLASITFVSIGLYGIHGPEDNGLRGLFNTREIKDLTEYLANLEEEAKTVKDELGRTQELVKLDRETRSKMTLLINNLESENARLKEDLAFFEGFVPGSLKGGIALKRLQVTKDAVPNQFRYKALLIQGSKNPTVTLNVQVLVTTEKNNKTDMMVLPTADTMMDPRFTVELNRFARVSGAFKIPEGSKVESVEIRLLESGTIRAQSTIKL